VVGYRTLARRALHEDVVRASRFVALAVPLEAGAGVEPLLSAQRAALTSASHHVWALRRGDELRWSDDGEPAGSAGRPVLEVVLKRDLDHVAIVVSRVFGGTKLGVGGLARAYAGAAARALDAAGERLVETRERWLVRLPYGSVDAVMRRGGDDPAVQRCEARYDAEGALLTLELLQAEAERWETLLADLTRGAAVVAARLDVDATGSADERADEHGETRAQRK